MQKLTKRLVTTLMLVLLFALPVAAQPFPEDVSLRSNPSGETHEALVSRFGIGFSGKFPYGISDYDLDQLKVKDIFPFGWYSDWTISLEPEEPEGMEYVQLVKVGPRYYPPNWNYLDNVVANNLGDTWFIGNEPECVYQGRRTPREYAEIYHDLYYFIKLRDPDAQVAVGGVVQPSKLRLDWLDQVLIEYERTYSEPMPMDAWTIHNQLLNESDEKGSWGAGIPVGITDTTDALVMTEFAQNADVELFKDHVHAFRAWMKENGYQDKPLIISEYGVLFPPDLLPEGNETAAKFMIDTFDFLLAARDEETGYPEDDYRLVQRWLWYSLNEEPYNNATGEGFNGALFRYDDPDQMTLFGERFWDYALGLYGDKLFLPLGLRDFE